MPPFDRQTKAPSTPGMSGKGAQAEYPQSSGLTGHFQPGEEHTNAWHKRRRLSASRGQNMKPVYMIIHRVSCTRSLVDGEEHIEHPENADYLDVPRLFANDTRGSHLRGTQILADFNEFYETNPGICMTIYRTYSCISYHRTVKDSFEILATEIDRQVFNRLRPWFFRLGQDGPAAIPASESIVFTSDTLREAMHAVVASDPNRLADWSADHNLKAPYDYFYHFRRSLRQQSALILGHPQREELDVLLDYINESQGADFEKADAAFASGNVHLQYFTKLFRPNELIVTIQDGYPRGYTAERSSWFDRHILRLECWSWAYDGSFRKAETKMFVPWPSPDVPSVPLNSLAAWPLRLDRSDLSQRLYKRGLDFWSCRHRRLVSYVAPVPTIFELRMVSKSNVEGVFG
jgi:hypothetical protein